MPRQSNPDPLEDVTSDLDVKLEPEEYNIASLVLCKVVPFNVRSKFKMFFEVKFHQNSTS
jgi:hypothetical protein